MTIRGKLVRDEIPSLILKNGDVPIVSEVQGDAYLEALFQKIHEECLELHTDRTAEEVADVFEVLMSIAKALGHDWQQVEQTRIKKLGERGGFERGIVLHSVD